MSVHSFDRVTSAIEQEAERVVILELHRRRAFLASLGSAEREAITQIAHRVAEGVAGSLVAGAQSNQALSHALHAIYLPGTQQA